MTDYKCVNPSTQYKKPKPMTIHELLKVKKARKQFQEQRKQRIVEADSLTDPIQRMNAYRQIAKMRFIYYLSGKN